jgi:hypothetical protein
MSFFNHIEQKTSDEAVECRHGRWFIKFGFAGFNSPANNRSGYDSKVSAESAIHRYEGKGEKK